MAKSTSVSFDLQCRVINENLLITLDKITRSSVTAEVLRDALCQSKSCKLLHSCTKKSYLKGMQ